MSVPGASTLPPVPTELVHAGKTEHLVLIVGAGASYESGLPTWGELLKRLYERACSEATDPNQTDALLDLEIVTWFGNNTEFLKKASFLKQTMGDSWIGNAIGTQFRVPTPTPTPIHRALARLSRSTYFVTTNYDSLLERAFEELHNKAPRMVLVTDIDGIRDFSPGDVFKLHGDCRYPNTIVLSAEDYFRVSHQTSDAWKLRLQALLQPPYQVVLVGYGFDDIDVQEVVHDLRSAYGEKLPGPFWLVQNGRRTTAHAGSENLRVIGLDGYGQVEPWLIALGEAIAAAKARGPTIVKVAAYAEKLDSRFNQDLRHCSELFGAEKYEEAENAYRDLLREVQDVLTADADRVELRQLETKCRLNIGFCLLCEQQSDRARELLQQLPDAEVALIAVQGRLLLAQALAQVGELPRAKLILDAVSDVPESETARMAETRALVDVLEGRNPSVRSELSPVVGLWYSRTLLERGELAEASRVALETIERDPDGTIVRLYSLMVLENALGQSVLEEAGSRSWIPIAKRGPVVRAIEEGLRWLGVRAGSPRFSRDIAMLVHSFGVLTMDERSERAPPSLTSRDVDETLAPMLDCDRFLQAEELARQCRLAEAIALLRESGHPWRRLHQEVHLRALADADSALNDAMDLARRFPGRAPIEYLVAYLLGRVSRYEEAISHAEAAFAALPGRGYRIFLAKCRVNVGRYLDAVAILDAIEPGNRPSVLDLRARALEAANDPRSIDAWHEYTLQMPEDIGGSLASAQVLFKFGRREDARQVAWAIFEEAREQMTAAQLFRSAKFQRLGTHFDRDARARIQDIADTLDRRFGGDPQAEYFRLSLLAELDFPDTARPVDLQNLVQTGLLNEMPLDELVEMIRNHQDRESAAYGLYRRGHASFESLWELTKVASAARVTGLIRSAEEVGPVFCPPISFFDAAPLSLAGTRILCGEFELLLLQSLDLLGPLRQALKPDGRLVIFRDVCERIVGSAATLEIGTQRVQLEELDQLVDRIHTHSKIDTPPRDLVISDGDWAKREKIAIIDSAVEQCPSAISARAMVQYLQSQGLISNACSARALHALEAEPAASAIRGPIPGRLAITYAPLLVFSDCRVLDAVLKVVDTLVISPRTLHLLQSRRWELRQAVSSAELATAVHDAVGSGIRSGWIDASLPRPTVPELPDVRPSANAEVVRDIYRKPLEMALAYRQALLNDSGLVLLTADSSVVSLLCGNPTQIANLAWGGSEAYVEFSHRMQSVDSRQMHLPILLAECSLPEARLKQELRKLVLWGFTDALRSEDLIDLVHPTEGFVGLDKVVPTKILDAAEWMLREPGHINATIAGGRIATVYARAIWEAFQLPGFESRARSVADGLLSRVERLDAHAHSLVDAVLGQVALLSVQFPTASVIQRGDESQMLDLSVESPAGRLWVHLNDWAGPSGSRRASLGRALRDAWCLLDEIAGPGGPNRVQLGPMLLADNQQQSPLNHMATRNDGNQCHLPSLHQPPEEALAILSATWQEHPLSSRGLLVFHGSPKSDSERFCDWEELLQYAVSQLSKPDINPSDLPFDERTMRVDFPLEGGVASIRVFLPIEAVVLRGPREKMGPYLSVLKRYQGRHDRRAYELLEQFQNSDGRESAARSYARHSVSALWRLVRDDPSYLLRWPRHWPYSTVRAHPNLESLCELLHEPSEPIPPDADVAAVIHDRETRVWVQGEIDVRSALFFQGTQIPGGDGVYPVQVRIREEYRTREVDVALRRLEHCEDYHAALLAQDIMVLRLAMQAQPQMSLHRGTVDLRATVPELLARTLGTLRSPEKSDAGSLARNEAALLRACGQVCGEVLSLHPERSYRDWLWYTYRLHAWLGTQLDSLSYQARSAGIQALAEAAPRPAAGAPPVASGYDDLFNPFLFERRGFDYRLALVLFSLTAMEELASEPIASGDGEAAASSPLSCPALEKELVELASQLSPERPFCESWFSWQAPDTTADLALAVLYRLNPERIIEVDRACLLARVNSWPKEVESLPLVQGRLIEMIVRALFRQPEKLESELRAKLEERLLGFAGGALENKLRWIGLTSLFDSGALHLRDIVSLLVVDHIREPEATLVVSRYLHAIASSSASALAPEVIRLQQCWAVAPDRSVEVLSAAVARLLMYSGESLVQSQAVELLLELAEQPGFQEDSRIKQLVRLLRVEEEVGDPH